MERGDRGSVVSALSLNNRDSRRDAASHCVRGRHLLCSIFRSTRQWPYRIPGPARLSGNWRIVIKVLPREDAMASARASAPTSAPRRRAAVPRDLNPSCQPRDFLAGDATGWSVAAIARNPTMMPTATSASIQPIAPTHAQPRDMPRSARCSWPRSGWGSAGNFGASAEMSGVDTVVSNASPSVRADRARETGRRGKEPALDQ